jgi:hypothetical protein
VPQGKGFQGLVRLWEVSTGKELRRWEVPAFAGRNPRSPLAFAPDSRRLALACRLDGPEAAAALARLADGGEEVASFLQKQLTQQAPQQPDRIAQWIVDLDSDRFQVRDQATRALEKAGRLAELALRKALKESRTIEAQRRIQNLLANLAAPSPEVVRAHRATEALELYSARPGMRHR